MPATPIEPGALRDWRLQRGMSLEEAAYRARVSYPYLRRLEDLGGNPSAALLNRLAEVYGRDARELFTPDHDPAGAR
jgi:transcriptional regulator with XRE-family HTH domain